MLSAAPHAEGVSRRLLCLCHSLVPERVHFLPPLLQLLRQALKLLLELCALALLVLELNVGVGELALCRDQRLLLYLSLLLLRNE